MDEAANAKQHYQNSLKNFDARLKSEEQEVKKFHEDQVQVD